MVNEKSLLFFFSSHTHTNYLFQRWQHFTLFFFFFSMYNSLLVVFFFSKRLPFDTLSLFFLVRLPLSLLLHILSLCLFEGGSILLSPSSCIPLERKSLFSLLELLHLNQSNPFSSILTHTKSNPLNQPISNTTVGLFFHSNVSN